MKTKITNKEEALLRSAEQWAAKLGRNKAVSLLVGRGVGASTAERIVGGRYINRPSHLLRTTLEALVSDNVG